MDDDVPTIPVLEQPKHEPVVEPFGFLFQEDLRAWDRVESNSHNLVRLHLQIIKS